MTLSFQLLLRNKSKKQFLIGFIMRIRKSAMAASGTEA